MTSSRSPQTHPRQPRTRCCWTPSDERAWTLEHPDDLQAEHDHDREWARDVIACWHTSARRNK